MVGAPTGDGTTYISVSPSSNPIFTVMQHARFHQCAEQQARDLWFRSQRRLPTPRHAARGRPQTVVPITQRRTRATRELNPRSPVTPPHTRGRIRIAVSDAHRIHGVTWSGTVRATSPALAVISNWVSSCTSPVATTNVALVAPGGTVTCAGTVATELLLRRLTMNPLTAAADVKSTVPRAL